MPLLCILVLLQLSLWQQNAVCIIESATGRPLSDCHVQIDGKTIGVSDASGVWVIPDVYKNSIVTITHIGYKSITVDLSKLGQGERMVALDSVPYSIDEVVVSGRMVPARHINMGVTGRRRKDYVGAKLFDSRLIGLYIPNKKASKHFEIQQVRIYISDDAVAPTASFWVSIYAGENDYTAPKEENKLYGPLLTRANNAGAYHTINVEHAHIKMPSGGLFVILQNNPSNEEQMLVKHHSNKQSGKVRFNPKSGHAALSISGGEASTTFRANYTTIGESWQHCNCFYNWGGRTSEHGSTVGFDGSPILWTRDTVQWELYPKNHAVQRGNSMIYVVLKEIKE